jgi:hypothetical protein
MVTRRFWPTSPTLLPVLLTDPPHLKPLLIITRRTSEPTLSQVGCTPGNLSQTCQANRFIPVECFTWSASEVVFPHISKIRDNFH